MSKENVIIIQADTDPAKKSIKDLRKELKDLKDEMTNLEEGSDAFLEVANKAGEVKHQIDEINESIKGASSDFGDLVGNVTNVAAGITGAFQAVAGGLQAMGVESRAIDETIKRMQGLMAVTQGLSSIDDGIKSFGKLTKAIQGSTGAMKVFKAVSKPVVLAAIAAAVVAIGAAWNKWGDSLRKSFPWLDKLIKKFDGTAAAEVERMAAAQEKFNEALAVSNAEVAKILEDRKLSKLTQEGKDELKRLQDDLKIAENELLHWQEELNNAGNNRTLWNNIREDARVTEEKIKQLKAAITSLYTDPKYQLSNQPTTSTTSTVQETQTTSEEQDLELIEFSDQDLADGLERIRKYWEEVYDIKLEQLKRSEKTNKEQLTQEIDIEKQRLTLYQEGTLEYEKQLTKIWGLETELKELTKETVEVTKTQIEKAEDLGNEIFETLKATTSAFSESSLGLTSGWITSLNTFQSAFQETMKLVKEDGEVSWTSYGQVAAQALGGVGQMLNALSQEQDASNEEGFKKTKQLQIAATVMNMLSGIMSAWSSAMSPANAWMTGPGQIAYGTLMSATIAGIGAAQIAKIQSQTMNSANSNTNINAKTTSSMIIPPVQYSAAVQGANTEGAIKDTKVYVTETDITSTVNKVSVQETENIY